MHHVRVFLSSSSFLQLSLLGLSVSQSAIVNTVITVCARVNYWVCFQPQGAFACMFVLIKCSTHQQACDGGAAPVSTVDCREPIPRGLSAQGPISIKRN